jgi:hypothetical protein
MEGWTAAVSRRRNSPGAARLTAQRLGWAMTAIIYFGEMLVASLLAIVLLAISQLGMSYHANPDCAVLRIFWQIWICFALVYLIAGGRRFRCGRANRLCLVFVRPSLRASRSR